MSVKPDHIYCRIEIFWVYVFENTFLSRRLFLYSWLTKHDFTLDVSKYFNLTTSKRPRLIIPYRDPTAELYLVWVPARPLLSLWPSTFSRRAWQRRVRTWKSTVHKLQEKFQFFTIGRFIVKYCQFVGRGYIIIIRSVLQYNYKNISYEKKKKRQYTFGEKNNIKKVFFFLITPFFRVTSFQRNSVKTWFFWHTEYSIS